MCGPLKRYSLLTVLTSIVHFVDNPTTYLFECVFPSQEEGDGEASD